MKHIQCSRSLGCSNSLSAGKNPPAPTSSAHTVRKKWHVLVGWGALPCIYLKNTYPRFRPNPSFAFSSSLQLPKTGSTHLSRLRSPRFSMQPYLKLLYYPGSFQYIFHHELCLPFIILWDLNCTQYSVTFYMTNLKEGRYKKIHKAILSKYL